MNRLDTLLDALWLTCLVATYAVALSLAAFVILSVAALVAGALLH